MWSLYEATDALHFSQPTQSLCFCTKTPPQSLHISVIDHQPAAQPAHAHTHKAAAGHKPVTSIEAPQIYSWERVGEWRAATSTRLSWMEVTTRVRAGITSHWCFTANRRWPRTTWRSGSASSFYICPVALTSLPPVSYNARLEARTWTQAGKQLML